MPEPEHPVLVELTGLLRGFSAKITIQPDVRNLARSVAYLEKQGFEPVPRPLVFDRTADGKPLCPKHKCIMQEREKQGDRWFSHKVVNNGVEHYCRGYAGPDSEGYWFDQDAPRALHVQREREPRPINGRAKQLTYNGQGPTNGHSAQASPWARTVPTKSRFGRGL